MFVFSRLGVIGVFAYLDVSRWQSRRSGIHLSKQPVNSTFFIESLFFYSTFDVGVFAYLDVRCSTFIFFHH